MKTLKIGIGLVGLGTVGSGTLKLLKSERARILRNTGIDCRIVKIAEINEAAIRKSGIARKFFTRDWREVAAHPGIDIVVELIGGTGLALEVITTALKNRKHVVTANKALLAVKGDRVFPLARRMGRVVGFEAAVCGGIPVIRALREGLAANRIRSIFGILNGTANFILSKMRFEGKPFAAALKEAQALGFAEADPSFDVEGTDSAHKIAILASLAFGAYFPFKGVHVEGITEVTDLDIRYAMDMGYCIKLLATASDEGKGAARISVAPTLIPRDEIIAEVNYEYNGVFINGHATSHTLYTGKGAGSLPTGSAVVSDILHIAAHGAQEAEHGLIYPAGLKGRVAPMDGYKAEFYIRLKAVDRPGVMAKISGLLGRAGISIATLVQKQSTPDGDAVVVIITHKTETRRVEAAIRKINRLSIVDGRAVRMRIINDLYH